MKCPVFFLLIVALIVLPARTLAAPPPALGLPKEVAAVLQKRCGECHGDKQPKAKLTLTTSDGLARGGRKGPVLKPGSPEGSRLWKMVQDEKMPPEEPLPQAER